MKKKIVSALLILFAIWLLTHPNTKALYKGLRASFIEAPAKQLKEDARKKAEEYAREREEKRAKEIEKELEKYNY